jgi:hypothetical protein
MKKLIKRRLDSADQIAAGLGGFTAGLKCPAFFNVMKKLVAETGADGDLVTALGAAAAEHGCTCLGLHAGKKAVGLGAVAAVRLKGALRHDKKLLRQVDSCSNF